MGIIYAIFGNRTKKRLRRQKSNTTAARTAKERLDYKNNKTAYNPDYKLTGKTISVNEVDLYPTKRKHKKEIAIVDGDNESNKKKSSNYKKTKVSN